MFAAHVAVMQPFNRESSSLDVVLRFLLCLLQKATKLTKKNGIEPADYSDPKPAFYGGLRFTVVARQLTAASSKRYSTKESTAPSNPWIFASADSMI